MGQNYNLLCFKCRKHYRIGRASWLRDALIKYSKLGEFPESEWLSDLLQEHGDHLNIDNDEGFTIDYADFTSERDGKLYSVGHPLRQPILWVDDFETWKKYELTEEGEFIEEGIELL